MEVASFDAGLFGITGAEALLMDPQQRLVLEVSHTVYQGMEFVPAWFGATLWVYRKRQVPAQTISCAVQVTWELLSRSNQSRTSIADRHAEMGVYIAIQQMEYGSLAAPFSTTIGPYHATGGSFSVAAGRVSFSFGLKGPAVSIDTACSSALVATHMGMQQARAKPQCGVLTAAVNLMLSGDTTGVTQAAGMLAMDGRCKTLDQAADGYVR